MSTPATDWIEGALDRLEEARFEAKRRKGLTSGDLCRMVEELSGRNVSDSTRRNYETGKQMAHMDYLYVVCRESGLSPHYVLTGDEPRRWAYRDNPEAQRVLMALRQAVEGSDE